MLFFKTILLTFFFFALAVSCTNNKAGLTESAYLEPVTYAQFEDFVEATNYLTDAEKFGWSIVQQNVFDFLVVDNATWQKPDGIHTPSSKNLPVTQVSYNDAIAYCNWSNTRLPSYDEYWILIKNDNRKIITNNTTAISVVDSSNVLGNVWEISATPNGSSVRLAGGSLFCSPKTCDGTTKERELYVDKETGNIHIGFAVVSEYDN